MDIHHRTTTNIHIRRNRHNHTMYAATTVAGKPREYCIQNAAKTGNGMLSVTW